MFGWKLCVPSVIALKVNLANRVHGINMKCDICSDMEESHQFIFCCVQRFVRCRLVAALM